MRAGTARVLLSLALAAGFILAIAFSNSWIIIVIAAVCCAISLRGIVGFSDALALVVLGVAVLVTTALMIAPLFPWPMDATASVAALVAGALGWSRIPHDRHIGSRPTRDALVLWLALLTAPTVWAIARFRLESLRDADRLSWVMRNDSGNNVLFAQTVLSDNGIVLGGLENPVPLPAGLLALTMGGVRGSIQEKNLLDYDFSALSGLWSVIIALMILLAGVTAAVVSRSVGGGTRTRAGAGLAASFMAVSWIYTGYPMEYGFLSAHIALIVIFCSVILFFSARASLLVVLAGLGLAVSALLATWSPLALLPGALAVVAGIRQYRSGGRLSSPGVISLGMVALQLTTYAVLGVVPVFLAQRQALSTTGGIYPFSGWLFGVITASFLLAAWAASGQRRSYVALGAATLAAAAVGGLSVLLWMSRTQPSPWTYYPTKFVWLVSLVFLVILVALAISYLASRALPRVAQGTGFGIVAAGIIGLIVWVPTSIGDQVNMNPVDRMFRGHTVETHSAVVEYVLDLAGTGSPSLLWDSGFDDESDVNIWLTQTWIGSLTEKADLRTLVYYSHTDRRPEMLCELDAQYGTELKVHTANSRLEAEILEVCPSTTAKFIVEQPRY